MDAEQIYDCFFYQFVSGGKNYSANVDSNSVGQLTGNFSSTMILGQFFFWYNVVVHDLTDPSAPKIGFGSSNLRYTPSSAPVQKGNVTVYPLDYVADDPHRYCTSVSVGSPAVNLRILVDTGSRDILVLSTSHFTMPWWVYAAAGVIALGFLIVVIVLLKIWVFHKERVLRARYSTNIQRGRPPPRYGEQ